jgi:hypothetical protein
MSPSRGLPFSWHCLSNVRWHRRHSTSDHLMSDDRSWASIRGSTSSIRLLVPLVAAAIASALYLLSTRSSFHLDGMKKFLAHLGGDKHVSPQQAPVQQVMPPAMTGAMAGGPHPSGKKNVGYFVSQVDPHVSALR